MPPGECPHLCCYDPDNLNHSHTTEPAACDRCQHEYERMTDADQQLRSPEAP